MLGAGLACLVHGLLPFLFTRMGSRIITQLHERMVINRRRVLTAAEDSAGSSLTLSATMETLRPRNVS
jgi:hypothetical protein